MNVGFATMEKFDNRVPNSVGSSRIRARWLINHWPESEEYMMGRNYDVLVFQKVYWREMMDKFEGKKIMDICDPDWLEGKPVFEFVDMMDAVVTSTEALAKFMKKVRPKANIICIPDRMNMAEFPKRKTEYVGKPKTIAWFGYNHNIHYIQKTFPDIIKKGLELVVISDQPYNPPLAYQSLKIKNVAYSYPGVHQELLKCDLVLMPDNSGDLRGSFKSNNKILTAWALGIPVVRVPEDLDVYEDPKQRQIEADRCYQEMLDKWDTKQSVEDYKTLISQLYHTVSQA